MTNNAIWNGLASKADAMTDRLGKGLDKNIKEVVMSIWLAGFHTTGSCEGHLDWGLKAPWIDIGKDPSDEDIAPIKGKTMSLFDIFEKYPKLKKIRNVNLKAQSELLDLLTEFYTTRKVSEHERIIITQFGIYGSMRLVSQGVEVQEINIKVDQIEKLKRYQTEMQDFGLFLKNKYLQTLQN